MFISMSACRRSSDGSYVPADATEGLDIHVRPLRWGKHDELEVARKRPKEILERQCRGPPTMSCLADMASTRPWKFWFTLRNSK